jgi:hypothetical protein
MGLREAADALGVRYQPPSARRGPGQKPVRAAV